MMLSNFLFRVRQYLHDNRAKVIRMIGIAIAAGALILLIVVGVEKIQKSRYEKRVQALEKEIRDADQKAKDAEARAEILRRAIDDKYDELRELSARADAAEAKMRDTKSRVIKLKEKYEDILFLPVPDTPVSCVDLCKQLSDLGYRCQ